MRNLSFTLAMLLATSAIVACSSTTAEPDADSSGDQVNAENAVCRDVLADYASTHAGSAPLRVVTEGAFEPFNFMDKGGKLVGWEVDYLDLVMKKLTRKYTLEARTWDGCCQRDTTDTSRGVPPPVAPGSLFSDVHEGVVDMGFAAISNGSVRQTVFTYSKHYGFTAMAQNFVFLKSRENELTLENGMSVLAGKTIAVQVGTNPFFYLSEQLNAAPRNLGIQILSFGTAQEAVAAVSDGSADYLFGLEGDDVRQSVDSGQMVADNRITTLDPDGIGKVWGTGAAFILPKSIGTKDANLVKAVNCAIDELTKEGVPERLNQKWKPGSYVYCSPAETMDECSARP